MPAIPAAFAAVAAGSATVGAIATVVSTVGMGLSVVGKVTGSKTLMKIGGVMGLVGGVTSLATSAFGAANAAGSAGAIEGAAGALGDTAFDSFAATQGAAEAGTSLAEFGGSAASWEPIGEALTGGLDTAMGAQAAAEASTPLTEFGGTEPSFTSPNNGLLNATQQQVSSVPDMSPADSYKGSAQQATDNQFLKSDYGYGPAPNTPAERQSWWNKQPERVKAAIIQGGLGAVGGLFDGWTSEQKLALEREKMNLMTSNANAQPVIKFATPTTQPKKVGLLNAQRGM